MESNFFYYEYFSESNNDFLCLDSKYTNRDLDRSTGRLRIKNCPITAEEVVTYFAIVDDRGNQEFPITTAQKHGFKYGDAIKVYRPKKEIERAIPSFESKKIVVGHKNVNIHNYKTAAVGNMGEMFRWGVVDGKDALFTTTYFDNPTVIDKIDKRELKDFSIGYDVKYVHISQLSDEDKKIYTGKFNGQAYDFIQTNIHCNHIAIIPPGAARCDVAQVADWLFNNNFEEICMSDNTENNVAKNATSVAPANVADGNAVANVADNSVQKLINEVPNVSDGATVEKTPKQTTDAAVADSNIKNELEKTKEELKKANDAILAMDAKYEATQKKIDDLLNAQTVAQDAKINNEKNIKLALELKNASIAHDSLDTEPEKAFDEYVAEVSKFSHGRINAEAVKAFSCDQKIAYMMGLNSNRFKFDLNKVEAQDSTAVQKGEVGNDGMTRFSGGKL